MPVYPFHLTSEAALRPFADVVFEVWPQVPCRDQLHRFVISRVGQAVCDLERLLSSVSAFWQVGSVSFCCVNDKVESVWPTNFVEFQSGLSVVWLAQGAAEFPHQQPVLAEFPRSLPWSGLFRRFLRLLWPLGFLEVLEGLLYPP